MEGQGIPEQERALLREGGRVGVTQLDELRAILSGARICYEDKPVHAVGPHGEAGGAQRLLIVREPDSSYCVVFAFVEKTGALLSVKPGIA